MPRYGARALAKDALPCKAKQRSATSHGNGFIEITPALALGNLKVEVQERIWEMFNLFSRGAVAYGKKP
jgi:hypothetical protein